MRSRTKVLTESFKCLVILNDKLELADLKTNKIRLQANINRLASKKFTIDDVAKIEPISEHGRSYTKF
jgi:hypothetical protein